MSRHAFMRLGGVVFATATIGLWLPGCSGVANVPMPEPTAQWETAIALIRAATERAPGGNVATVQEEPTEAPRTRARVATEPPRATSTRRAMTITPRPTRTPSSTATDGPSPTRAPTRTRTPRPTRTSSSTPTYGPSPTHAPTRTRTPTPIPHGPPAQLSATLPTSIPCERWSGDGCWWHFTVTFTETGGVAADVQRTGRRYVDRNGGVWIPMSGEWGSAFIKIPANGSGKYSSWVRSEARSRGNLMGGEVIVGYSGYDANGNPFKGEVQAQLIMPEWATFTATPRLTRTQTPAP